VRHPIVELEQPVRPSGAFLLSHAWFGSSGHGNLMATRGPGGWVASGVQRYRTGQHEQLPACGVDVLTGERSGHVFVFEWQRQWRARIWEASHHRRVFPMYIGPAAIGLAEVALYRRIDGGVVDVWESV